MAVKRWIFIVAVFMTILSFYSIVCDGKDKPIHCPKPFCHCKKRIATCNGPTTVIPKLPRYITHVKFTNTNFTRITGALLLNLTHNVIKRLDFVSTNTVEIDPDAFGSFPNLTKLSFNSNSRLQPATIASVLNATSTLTTLYLESNGWTVLPTILFSDLHESDLTEVVLRDNAFELVNCSVFSNLHLLETLDLSNNAIINMYTTGFESTQIRSLNLSYNNLLRIPSFCGQNGKQITKNVQSIDFTGNPIFSLNQSSLSCLNNLHKLTLNNIALRKLENNTFSNSRRLQGLYMNSNGNHLKAIEPLAFNSSTLVKILFRDNGFNFKRQFSYSRIFSLVPKLEHLDLTNNKLPSNSKDLRDMFSPLKKLKKLYLQSTSLKMIPRNVFQHMSSLSKLSLIGNYISGWNDDPKVFENVTSLRSLYLDGNNIKTINKTSFPVNFLKSLRELNLMNNPFSCTCDLMWFMDWIKSKRNTTLTDYPHRYKCYYPPNMNKQLLNNYNPTKEKCSNIDIIVQNACIGISAVFIIVVLIVSLSYRYRFYIHYWLHVVGIKRLGYYVLKNDADYQYDAYVISCEDDQHFVINQLMPELEEKANCRLYIYARDSDPGALIIDNITTKFAVSKNVILIMSTAFLESEWCSYELALTQTKAVREGPGIVTVVLMEELELSLLTSPVRALLDMVPHYQWPEDGNNQRRFWGQILTSLNTHVDSDEESP